MRVHGKNIRLIISIMTSLLLTSGVESFAAGAQHAKAVRGRKTASSSRAHRKPYVPTPEELKTAQAGEEELLKASVQEPPSELMQKKMQSGM